MPMPMPIYIHNGRKIVLSVCDFMCFILFDLDWIQQMTQWLSGFCLEAHPDKGGDTEAHASHGRTKNESQFSRLVNSRAQFRYVVQF